MSRSRASALVAGVLLACSGLPAVAMQDDPVPSREDRRAALLERARLERSGADAREIEGAIRRASQPSQESGARAAQYGPILSLRFDGGTVLDYVAQLKAAADPAPTNILIRGDAEAIEVSPVDLREVTLFSALQLVSGDYRDGGTPYSVRTTNLGAAGDSAAAFLVEVADYSRAGRPTAAARDVLVMSLRELTTPLPGDPPEVVIAAETVLTAIETAVEIASDDRSGADLKYHPESGLLIMSGDGRVLIAAEAVLDRIKSDLRERRGRAIQQQQVQGLTNPDALEERLADARAEAELMSVQMSTAQRRLEVLAEQFEHTRSLKEENFVSGDELLAAQLALHEADAEVQERRIKLQRAMDRVNHAEEALARAREIASGGGAQPSEMQQLRNENALLRERLATLENEIAKLRSSRTGGSRSGGSSR